MTPRAIARVLLVLAVMSVAPRLEAQPPMRDGVASTEDQRKAQDHFTRARELYLGGSYREAIAELEVARKLDPRAKDLVLNLAIVHEKLGKYDEALGHLHTYLEMEGVTPADRTRAEGMIKRIEGAKQRSAASAKPSPPPDLVRSPSPSGPPPPVGPPPHGRWDGYTLGAVIISGVGIAAGAAVGLWALSERPTDFVTGRDGSYSSFQNKTSSAHHAAIASDVFFGVGLVSAAAAVALYFARTRDVPPASPAVGLAALSSGRIHVSVLPAGGAVGLGGSF